MPAGSWCAGMMALWCTGSPPHPHELASRAVVMDKQTAVGAGHWHGAPAPKRRRECGYQLHAPADASYTGMHELTASISSQPCLSSSARKRTRSLQGRQPAWNVAGLSRLPCPALGAAEVPELKRHPAPPYRHTQGLHSST